MVCFAPNGFPLIAAIPQTATSPYPDWGTVAVCAGGIASVVGLILLGMFYYLPGWARPWAGTTVFSYLAEAMQVVSTLVGGYGTYLLGTAQKPGWFPPVCVAAIGLFVWKLVVVKASHLAKKSEEEAKQDLATAKDEGQRRTRLIRALGTLVDDKITRLTRALQDLASTRRQIKHVRDTLTPAPHLEEALNGLGSLLIGQAESAGAENPVFRVGVYVNQGGALRPVHGIKTNEPGVNPFTSFNSHRPAFQLSGNAPASHAVRCIRAKTMLIVEDCAAAATSGDFTFLHDDQKSYLCSLVAYPLGQVCDECGTMREAALVLDTPLAGFFKASERDSLEYALKEFARRIRLELALQSLLRSAEG